jgi:hypothetical protein
MNMKKLKIWQIYALLLVVLNIIVRIVIRLSPAFCEWYALHIHKTVVNIFGSIWGIFPFSVIELLLYGAALTLVFFIVLIIIRIVKKKYNRDFARLGKVLLCIGLTAVTVYMFNSEVNYNRRTFPDIIGLKTQNHPKETVRGALEYICEIAYANMPYVTFDQGLVLSENTEQRAAEAMKKLAEQYDILKINYPRPKPVLTSRFWLSQGTIAGVYSPFTLEANYNSDMPEYDIPETVCHELSHLTGFMREDEANFIAFLACMNSEDPDFIYSGAAIAVSNLYNAYASVATDEEIAEVYEIIPIEFLVDYTLGNKYWQPFREKPMQAVYTAINDTVLKAQGQEDGVKSYGRVTDLILAWYEENR